MDNRDVTNLLLDLSQGDAPAVNSLLPVIYNELRRLAASFLRWERPEHTLQPTALVHEAYLRLVDQTKVNWKDRAHFFGVAAHLMRQILIDHARMRNADKRGGGVEKLQLDDDLDKPIELRSELIELDEALCELAKLDPEKARLVELRYFGGLSFEETAEVLGISTRTAKRHWRLARAWLHGEMTRTN